MNKLVVQRRKTVWDVFVKHINQDNFSYRQKDQHLENWQEVAGEATPSFLYQDAQAPHDKPNL